jgi:hypothetical protein
MRYDDYLMGEEQRHPDPPLRRGDRVKYIGESTPGFSLDGIEGVVTHTPIPRYVDGLYLDEIYDPDDDTSDRKQRLLMERSYCVKWKFPRGTSEDLVEWATYSNFFGDELKKVYRK